MVNLGTRSVVTIGGVDVSAHVTAWSVSEIVTKTVDEAKIMLSRKVEDSVSLENEQAVLIQRGRTTGAEATIFRGFLKLKKPKGMIYEIIAENKLGQLKRRQVTKNYDIDIDSQAGVLSAIVDDLVVNYGGLTITASDSTGITRALDTYICNRDSVLERVEALREVLDWVLRYDHSADTVIFEPKGNTTHATVLRYNGVGTTNVQNVLKWEIDSEAMFNRVEVIGRSQTDYATFTDTASAAQTTFTLPNVPGMTEVTVDGVKQVLGVTGSTSTFDYTVKQHTKQIIFEVAMSGAEAIVVNYGSDKPISVIVEDSDSITTYCPTDPVSGAYLPFEKSFKFDDVVTMEDAEKRADEILKRFSKPLRSTIIEIAHQDTLIRAGNNIRVVDSINGIDDFFTVIEILYQWPLMKDVIHVGQERMLLADSMLATDDRLRKLERRELRNIDLVRIRKDLVKELRLTGYMSVERRDTSMDGAWNKGFGDGVSVDDLTWGEATGIYQSAYTNSLVRYVTVWPSDVYEEEFTETTFVDAANTTATVDAVTDYDCTFAADEELHLKQVHMKIGGTEASPTSITVVNVWIPSNRITTGTLTSVSVKTASGNNWETISGDTTVDEGANHTFTTPGTELWIKVVSSDAVISGKNSAGLIVPAIMATVVTTA